MLLCYDTRYDWYQTDCSVTVVVYTRHNSLQRSDVIIELTPSTIESTSPQTLHVRILVNDHTYHVNRGQAFLPNLCVFSFNDTVLYSLTPTVVA